MQPLSPLGPVWAFITLTGGGPGGPSHPARMMPRGTLWDHSFMQNNWLRFAALLAAIGSASAGADTIYLCKSYSGGRFWSSAHCHKQSALIERIVSVPDGMSFEHQVQLGNQEAAQAAKLAAPARPPVQVYQSSAQSGQSECAAIEAEITRLDNLARQPNTGPMQDWIRGRRQTARDRQSSLRC